MTDVSKLPRVTVPTMDRMTYADLGRIREETGVLMQEAEEPMERKFAASEWLARTKAGQAVTFDDVYETGNLAGVDIEGAEDAAAEVDPTQTLPGT